MIRAAACAAVLAAAAAVAVDGRATRQPPAATFRSGVEVVELDVSVTRGGVPVSGLTARDFALTDNGVAQEVASVMLDRLPLSVTLLLDTSTSVAGQRLDHLRLAGEGLVDALRPDDRAALITFSHTIDVRVSMTEDMAAIRDALVSMRAAGATALRDAVQLAISLQTHDRSRPLILIFTDGADTASWLTADAVVDTARRAGIVIHAVRVDANDFLERLTELSGGRTWSANSDRQLRELFTTALEEMRARYLLTYTPRGVNRPGWHDLKVRLRNGRADITARPGYFVAATSPSESSPRP
jgi:Ca-activated chloride channel family protein